MKNDASDRANGLTRLARGWKGWLGAGAAEKRVAGQEPSIASEPGICQLSEEGRRHLLALARRSILSAAAKSPQNPPADTELAPELAARRACFVTLTCDGALRGCVGNLSADCSLAGAVWRNAAKAAFNDPRFPPVTLEEVDRLRIEISVLTEPRVLRFNSPDELIAQLRPGIDGVVLRVGPRVATLLPQVWTQLPAPRDFLRCLSRKAGCGDLGWQEPDAEVSVYQVEHFAEPERGRA